MKLREMAVAVAALSLAGAAVAAGNDTSTSTHGRAASDAASTQHGQSANPGSTAGTQATRQSSSQTGSAGSSQMGNSSAPAMGNGSSASSQGSMASEEHDPQFVRQVQQALKEKGFDVGQVDGQMGPETESALRQFQQSKGLPQSGNLDQQTLSQLGVEPGATQSQGASSQGSSSQGAQQNTQGSRSNSSSIHGSAYK
jgi:His-Xaa-Ser repeat protein HxsA